MKNLQIILGLFLLICCTSCINDEFHEEHKEMEETIIEILGYNQILTSLEENPDPIDGGGIFGIKVSEKDEKLKSRLIYVVANSQDMISDGDNSQMLLYDNTCHFDQVQIDRSVPGVSQGESYLVFRGYATKNGCYFRVKVPPCEQQYGMDCHDEDGIRFRVFIDVKDEKRLLEIDQYGEYRYATQSSSIQIRL